MATDLPRLNLTLPITRVGGTPKYEFHVSWDKLAHTINKLEDAVDALEAGGVGGAILEIDGGDASNSGTAYLEIDGGSA